MVVVAGDDLEELRRREARVVEDVLKKRVSFGIPEEETPTSGGDESTKRGSVYAAAPLPPGSPFRPPPPRGSPLAAPRPPPPADAPAVAALADAERDLLARLEEADAAAARLGPGSAAGDAWRARRDRLARDLEDLQGDLGAAPRRRRGSQRAALLAELAADDAEDPDCGSRLCLA